MDINSSQQTTTPPLFAPQNETADAGGATALSSDFETFLRMLTVQMENQDPLNPVESTDFAVQLATFSSVEQQVLTNDLLTALSGSMAGGGLGTLGQWVGMEVRGGQKASFTGQPIDLNVPTTDEADRRLLVVSNELGQPVTRLDLDLTSTDLTWDGALANGGTAPDGVFSFRVEAYKEGQLLESAAAETYAKVKEARIEGGQSVLVLDGDFTIRSSDVTALREPQSP